MTLLYHKDQSGKREFRGKFSFPNVKKLHTRSHAKYLNLIRL
jgi:hypothetical protein